MYLSDDLPIRVCPPPLVELTDDTGALLPIGAYWDDVLGVYQFEFECLKGVQFTALAIVPIVHCRKCGSHNLNIRKPNSRP